MLLKKIKQKILKNKYNKARKLYIIGRWAHWGLHNISIMKALLGDEPYIGQKIWVIKSNQIIPQITRAEV